MFVYDKQIITDLRAVKARTMAAFLAYLPSSPINLSTMFIHNVQAQNTRKKKKDYWPLHLPSSIIVKGSRHDHDMQTSTVSYVHETSGAFTHIHVMQKK